MNIFDFTADTPKENIAIDEQLLDLSDNGKLENTLRFWESTHYFVVMGISGKEGEEANVAQCNNDNIPILKRCSGGGTVLQGPGCLNYSLILKINDFAELKDVPSTNKWIMNEMKQALSPIFDGIDVRGYTDLAQNKLKFSGNAQRRKRHSVLFHGTFLYNFDLSLITKYLAHPKRQPDYRENREHLSFVQNIHLDPHDIKSCIANYWKATTKIDINFVLNS